MYKTDGETGNIDAAMDGWDQGDAKRKRAPESAVIDPASRAVDGAVNGGREGGRSTGRDTYVVGCAESHVGDSIGGWGGS